MTRIIAHVDMDAFYASVEQRDAPALRGKPVVVGGQPQTRGVVAAASYEARRFGVHSAMPSARALRLCPHAVLLPPRFEHYRAVSHQIREVFLSHTPLVEPLSLDEAFLDLSGRAHTVAQVRQLGAQIKAQVHEKTQLTCSVGLAPNKFLAKLASEQDKPDGLFVLRQEEVGAFLVALPLDKLWGVGPATRRKLAKLGIDSIPALQARALPELVRELGSYGAHLWHLARGLDERPVEPDRPTKSLSRETTFAEDLTDPEAMKAVLQELCQSTVASVRRHKLKGKTVHIKVRLGDFTTLTRNTTLAWPTQDAAVVWRTVLRLFEQRVALEGRGVRLLGVGISGLSLADGGQLPLFPYEELAIAEEGHAP